MHYLVTGHTGFKGAWLTMLLLNRGHRVSGLAALDPPEGGMFKRAGLAEQLVSDFRVDIRDAGATAEAWGRRLQTSWCIWPLSRWSASRIASRGRRMRSMPWAR